MKYLFHIFICMLAFSPLHAQVHDKWNRQTLTLIEKEHFSHESISSDSLKILFRELVKARGDHFQPCFDSARGFILITEIYDLSSGRKMRREQSADYSNAKGCFCTFENDTLNADSMDWNFLPDWNNKTVNELKPRPYVYWTGSCTGSRSDIRAAMRKEKRINKDTSFIETYVKIETRIDVKKNTIDIAFFIPQRGKREVNPYNGMWGDETMRLSGYFDRDDNY
ncbi:MAG: hypothetical protein JWO09_3112 [Bacteroidetes bacterium]|nr:hypothetical protein [Bacteroidota bacterium]